MPQPQLPSPVGEGWCVDAKTGNLLPDITTKDPVPKDMIDLIYCKYANVPRKVCDALEHVGVKNYVETQ